jgi:hypothetical protein
MDKTTFALPSTTPEDTGIPDIAPLGMLSIVAEQQFITR